jgi:hypothetical protein
MRRSWRVCKGPRRRRRDPHALRLPRTRLAAQRPRRQRRRSLLPARCARTLRGLCDLCKVLRLVCKHAGRERWQRQLRWLLRGLGLAWGLRATKSRSGNIRIAAQTKGTRKCWPRSLWRFARLAAGRGPRGVVEGARSAAQFAERAVPALHTSDVTGRADRARPVLRAPWRTFATSAALATALVPYRAAFLRSERQSQAPGS